MESEKQKGKILIVDDTPANIQVLGALLSKHNYDVYVAQSGEETLESVSKIMPDLILLDVMMRGIDGYETCRRMKSSPNVKQLPVIFLTARVDEEDIVHGFDVGGVDYIAKPFKSSELLARVATHVELKRAREEINSLRGIIPICAHCKKIRHDDGIWEQVESYVQNHSDASFSHGMCPACEEELYGDQDWWIKSKKK